MLFFFNKNKQAKSILANLPITTPSILGPNALPNSGGRMGVDSNASSGRSRKHFIKWACGNSGEQLTWCDTMAAYLAGSLTRDHGASPEPDINIARWNSSPVSIQQTENRIRSWSQLMRKCIPFPLHHSHPWGRKQAVMANILYANLMATHSARCDHCKWNISIV